MNFPTCFSCEVQVVPHAVDHIFSSITTVRKVFDIRMPKFDNLFENQNQDAMEELGILAFESKFVSAPFIFILNLQQQTSGHQWPTRNHRTTLDTQESQMST